MGIHTRNDVERVGAYRDAYCGSCDAQYGAHADGACPQCGTELDFSPNYAALLVAGFEGIARQLGREHAPDADAHYPVCSMCTENTPLALEWAGDVPKSSAVDAVVADAEDAVERLGEDPHWVRTEITGAYTDAYREACADATECSVCRDAHHDDDMECGHTEHGEPCPYTAAQA